MAALSFPIVVHLIGVAKHFARQGFVAGAPGVWNILKSFLKVHIMFIFEIVPEVWFVCAIEVFH